MAQYGSEQYGTQEGHQTHHNESYTNNPLHSTGAGQQIGGPGAGTTVGTGVGHLHEQEKHGGILHRTGSGSSSSSEDDGMGGRRKKKGVTEKIKEKLTGGDEQKSAAGGAAVGGGGYGYEGEEGHEKKGLMEKIKEKLPGGGQQ